MREHGGSFVRWVDTYLKPADTPNCNALDLYAVRCGVLHTLTPDADLITKGDAKPIAYSWGNADPEQLRKLFKRVKQDQHVIHTERMRDVLRTGFDRYVEDVQADPNRVILVAARLRRTFGPMSEDFVAVALDFLGDKDA